MAIQYPDDRKEIESAAKADVAGELENSNPYLRRSFLLSIIRALAGRMFDFYNQLRQLEIDSYPNTARGFFIDLWGSWVGKARNPATVSDGFVNFLGTLASPVGAGTQVTSSDGKSFITTSAAVIGNDVLTVSLVQRSGTTVTVDTDEVNSFGSGMDIRILGADQPEYNGVHTIVSTGDFQFQYEIATTPVTPATGIITADVDRALSNVESLEKGIDQNVEASSELSLSTPLAGVNSIAIAGSSGIDGGSDDESDDNYRRRVQERYANPVSLFNEQAIKEAAEAISGVTRVWVFETTPAIGDVTISFVRDNDPDIIPSAAEVTDVKDAIMAIAPANTDESLVFVNDPAISVFPVNFIFTAIFPTTVSLKDAIAQNLAQFFREDIVIGKVITEDTYRAIIQNSVSPDSGEQVQSFTLSAPSGDIILTSDQVPVLGTITYI